MDILRGYCLRPNLQNLLQQYCYYQEVVVKDDIFIGQLFGKEREVTQGDPVSPIIFNIVMNIVVMEILL